MPQPQKRLVSKKVTPFDHVIARCVRRHFLCGVDPLTGGSASNDEPPRDDRVVNNPGKSEVSAVSVSAITANT
ncbi:MAG: hypothetical protein LC637_06310 [Xanthomonadaceae bacterium]|nr:hypothetical protein [Xanthomonadaceae bacterium]